MALRPGETVFAVNSAGRVFSLGKEDSKWREFDYLGLEFKRVSAARNVVWAVGADHQVYVYVYGIEVPIRVKEVCYENERWNPMTGFGDKLLPTDRPHFSDVTGTQEREREMVEVPGLAWVWDDDWHIDTLLNGAQLEMGGWTYAVDFPAEYQPKKGFTSCVRRRRWIRHMRYVATNSWSSLPEKVEEEEPFIDLSVGGQEMAGVREGELQVWSVTLAGKVKVRQGVRSCCPQGTGWLNIPTTFGKEVSQVSVAPSGVVWAVTWQGSCLVRLGVSLLDPSGTHWCEVAAPSPHHPLTAVSLGRAIVWAVARGGGVWLRQGVMSGGSSEQLARGTRWVEMVGDLSLVCVGGGDQVLGLGLTDRNILVRTGVSSSDLTGKMWRPLTAEQTYNQPGQALDDTSWLEKEEFGKKVRISSSGDSGQRNISCEEQGSQSSSSAGTKDEKFLSENEESLYQSSLDSLEPAGRLVLDNEDKYDDIQWDRAVSQTVWVWVTLGSCHLDSIPAQWISDGNKSVASLSLEEEPWRRHILQQLNSNNKLTESERYQEYQPSIESSSWIKTCQVKVNSGGSRNRWEKCVLELEQCGSEGGKVDFGTLSMFGEKTKEHISLSEITCVSVCTEKSSPQLAVFTPSRSSKLLPLLVKFSSESEMLDWHGELVTSINNLHGTTSTPHQNSVYSLTARGEVMVWDSQATAQIGEEENSVIGSQYSIEDLLEIPVENKPMPLTEKLCNGFGSGSALYSEIKIGKSCDNFAVNLQCGKPGGSGDICLHFNPRLGGYDCNHVVLNTFHSATGAWGQEEKQPLIVMCSDGTASRAFAPDQTIQLVIKSDLSKFEIFVNGVKFASFLYRLKPENVSHVRVGGDVEVVKMVYNSRQVIMPPTEMYWRSLGGGHLLVVETCPQGVVMGLGYDSRCWVYTGGWGGAHHKPASSHSVNTMTDTKYFYIYENQRWNPLTGFSSSGLPTDRYMWSDKSGLHSASKESVRLPGGGWQWTGDWVVDHHTPGGTDRDGWQYAKDFPASYHPESTFTDYVRRRRWARRCSLTTSGPWRLVGNTKLLDLSLQPYTAGERAEGTVRCWAVATNGEALFRVGVTRETPGGQAWSHVKSDLVFQSVSVGEDGEVWLVSGEGQVFWRQGVTASCPSGQAWVQLASPDSNTRMRSVEAGRAGIFAVDTSNKLWVRRGVSPQFPEGVNWSPVCGGVRSVSVGGRGDLWAVLDEVQGGSGVLARRSVNSGEDWELGIGGGWKQVSVRGLVK